MIKAAFGRLSPPAPNETAGHDVGAEFTVQDPDAHPLHGTRNPLGRITGRLFGLLWLIFLVDFAAFLHRQTFDLPAAIAAWGALAIFVGAYVGVMTVGTPVWVSRIRRDLVFNRSAIWSMIAITGIFALVFPTENFGFVYIYAAVSSGMFLFRTEATRIILGLAILSALSGIFASASSGNILSSTLLVGGIGMNTVFWSALMAQNRELRRARAEITRLAVSEERLRFARDVHDLLGHSLSLIALKTELAGRLLESHPSRAALEIADVERVARIALQEVRDAVTGYRAPSLGEELENARQTLTAAGISVRIVESVADLPMEFDRVLAWFVREGTTNVIRHAGAGAGAVSVSISRAKDEIFAEMTDDGCYDDRHASPSDRGSGHGLVGLRERIHACSGSLTTGRMPGGGFRIYARIPVPEMSSGDADPVSAAESVIETRSVVESVS